MGRRGRERPPCLSLACWCTCPHGTPYTCRAALARPLPTHMPAPALPQHDFWFPSLGPRYDNLTACPQKEEVRVHEGIEGGGSRLGAGGAWNGLQGPEPGSTRNCSVRGLHMALGVHLLPARQLNSLSWGIQIRSKSGKVLVSLHHSSSPQ